MAQISEAILQEGWQEQRLGGFAPSEKESSVSASRAQNFLRILKKYIEPHIKLREDRETNYEDLHAAAIQIVQDAKSILVNPMLQGSVAELRKATEHLTSEDTAPKNADPLALLAERSTHLIHCAVMHRLLKLEQPTGMDAITEVAQSTEELDIFTLNHDLLIERQFEKAKVAIADGFVQRNAKARRFTGVWKGRKVRLYKLHGSIDSYPCEFTNGWQQFARVKGNPERLSQATRGRVRPINLFPFLFVGTTEKERRYGVGVPGEIFFEVHRRLKTHQRLICCGYGWSDNGINNRLGQWVQRSNKNKLIVLHGDSVDQLKQRQFLK